MNTIDLKTYTLYCKYNGQAEWENDFRVAKPNDVYHNIGEHFAIIEIISNNLYMIKSGFYSEKLVTDFWTEINEIKKQVSDEVYEYLDKNECIYPKSNSKTSYIKTFFSRLQKMI